MRICKLDKITKTGLDSKMGENNSELAKVVSFYYALHLLPNWQKKETKLFCKHVHEPRETS